MKSDARVASRSGDAVPGPVRLTLLGGFLASAPDGSRVALRSGKDAALLACLALSGTGRLTRDALTGLLWSTRSEAQARASLRQSLWAIRRSLGPAALDVLEVDRTAVTLREGAIETDVGRFHALAERDDAPSLRAAADLYAGDLLAGVTVRDPAWEEWLTPLREHLRRTLLGVLGRLAGALLAAGDPEGAIAVAERLLALDPLDEDGHRALMRAYLAQDRRALALHQYERCREAFDRELGAAPSPQTEALRRRIVVPLPPPGDDETAHATPAQALRTMRPAPDRPSIVVMPLASPGGGEEAASLAAGLTESVTMALTRFPELFVINHKTAKTADDDPIAFATRLGVDYATDGSVRRAGGRFRITVQLVDAGAGESLWSERFDRESSDLLALEDELAERVVATLAGRIGDLERRRLARRPPADLAVHELVLLGRDRLFRFTREHELAARSLFERALALDPDHAPALAGLALSHVHEYESTWSVDPDTALVDAYRLACRAVALDANDSIAQMTLATAYYYRGEHDLARIAIDRAVAINPFEYHAVCARGWLLMAAGDRVEGLACLADAMCRTPLTPDNCLISSGMCEFLDGRYEDALRTFGRMAPHRLDRLGSLAACYAKLGRRREARAAAREFLDLAAREFPPGERPAELGWQHYWRRLFGLRDDADRGHLFDAMREAGLPV